eukprot:TRINITY_DN6860_c0_g1_i9.p1 TRINITY_DN6860_c0_g1~~TRINITY_DN6860_c0_g1_i9.p1  ORF type:complete len:178 (-),score=27.05 TRINITY_DN6860_c0_g1_i9:691-1224(-)
MDVTKSLVYGGINGCTTSSLIMAVNTGCSLPPQVGLAITIAVLAPKALSSGLFDYVITKSETGYTKAEMKREIWEYENYPDGEKKEMVDIYVSKGLSKKDASDLVELLCRNENIFIGTMMAEELGLLPPTDQSPVPYSTCHSVGFLCCGLFFLSCDDIKYESSQWSHFLVFLLLPIP